MEFEVTIPLTVPEAIVLFAFVKRYSQTDQLMIVDQAEQRALWNLECLWEKADQPSWPTFEEAYELLRDDVD